MYNLNKLQKKYLSLKLSALALAIGTVCVPAYTVLANDQSVLNLKDNKGSQLLNSVSTFASYLDMQMLNKSTYKYIDNQLLAASSTFPLRVFKVLNVENFKTSPFMPIPQQDLACYYGVPAYKEPVKFDINQEPVNISADEVNASFDKDITYKGNVDINQVDNHLYADSASYNQETSTIVAKGNVSYVTGAYSIYTLDSIKTSLQEHTSTIKNANFILHGSVARGSSEQIDLNNQTKNVKLNKLSFSTCPVGKESWHIEAQDVQMSGNEAFGVAKNAKLYVGKVPILYVPYIKFPTTNERQTGLLYPRMSISSNNGFDLATPIYLNLAPNYDMTLTPRIMTKRGVALDTEFRFMLFENSLSKVNFYYIPHDSNSTLIADSKERWLFDFENQSYFFNRDLLFDIKYQRVRPNDYNFISDFGIDGARITDDSLEQKFLGSYIRPDYDLNLELRRYQSLIPSEAVSVKPFAMLPQIRGAYYQSYNKFNYNLAFEATNFQSESEANKGYYNASRLHFEPTVNYLFFNTNGMSLNTTIKGFFTHYDQDNNADMPSYFSSVLGFDNLDTSVNRALYLIDVRAKAKLERRALDLRHTQTLEPEIAYQYIPYKNQNNIGLYDTTDRLTDYYTNFSYRRFAGIDRISDLNQLTVGLSSRILDPHDRELYRFSISQAYSFRPSQVTLLPYEQASSYPRTPLAASINASPIDEITAHGNIVYDSEKNIFAAWTAMLEYKLQSGILTQLSYRFANNGNTSIENKVVDLSQIGLLISLPINDSFKLIGASYRDLEQDRNIDSKLALKYEDCCYSVSFIYERYNKTNWEQLNRSSENIFGMEFEFKGIGAVKMSGSNNATSPNTQLIDYFNPTNLNR